MTIVIILIFIFGYRGISFENAIRINKAAKALVTSVLLFIFYSTGYWGLASS
jgi:hypothetical protein